MELRLTIQRAAPGEAPLIHAVLLEAARWLVDTGQAMWRDNELDEGRLTGDVIAGSFYVAKTDSGEIAGVFKYQLEDTIFWPDLPLGEAAYLHRLAVRRPFAGGGVSRALLQFALQRTRELHRPFLRLDCEASRTRLRAVYERFGFQHHSDRQVGPYFVSRYQYPVDLS